jgi:N-formylglutamate deformylase
MREIIIFRESNFKILGKKPTTPILAHIPHASERIPSRIRRSFVISGVELKAELIRMTDSHTDELFASASKVGTIFANKYSRLVMDPERFRDDKKEIMADRGMGAIYTKTSSGDALRRALDVAEREKVLAGYYDPYHKRLNQVAGGLLKTFGACLIIDGHSFPSKPLPYELDRSANRPDICIGTDAFHTPPGLRDMSVRFFKRQGLKVSVDKPFSGSLVPLVYYRKNQQVKSIMIEINRKLYMNERNGRKSRGFRSIKKAIDRYILEAAYWWNKSHDLTSGDRS